MRLRKTDCINKKIQSKELLSAAWAGARRAESVGLHDTLAHDVSEYVKQSQRAGCGGKGRLHGVPPALADYRESAIIHRTEGLADDHYLQLADQMLQQGTHTVVYQQPSLALCKHIRPSNIGKAA